MRKETKNFIIESDENYEYFDEVIDHILANEERLMNFFEISSLPQKITILIQNYENFSEFFIKKYGYIQDYVRGNSDAITKTIKMLNIEDQVKYTTHKNANLEQFKGTTLHEIVHQLQNVLNPKSCIWFSEALATNLSNQTQWSLISLDDCDFGELQKNFNRTALPHKYGYAYVLGRYILGNYPHEEILKFCSDPEYLIEKSNDIFYGAKDWVNEQLNTNSKK